MHVAIYNTVSHYISACTTSCISDQATQRTVSLTFWKENNDKKKMISNIVFLISLFLFGIEVESQTVAKQVS
jgi:hypothetical protein